MVSLNLLRPPCDLIQTSSSSPEEFKMFLYQNMNSGAAVTKYRLQVPLNILFLIQVDYLNSKLSPGLLCSMEGRPCRMRVLADVEAWGTGSVATHTGLGWMGGLVLRMVLAFNVAELGRTEGDRTSVEVMFLRASEERKQTRRVRVRLKPHASLVAQTRRGAPSGALGLFDSKQIRLFFFACIICMLAKEKRGVGGASPTSTSGRYPFRFFNNTFF